MKTEGRELTLVINLGLRSVRAVVFDGTGKKIAQHNLPIKTMINGDFVEQVPEEWWRLCKELIKKTTKKDDIRKNIRHLSVTSSSCNLVIIDKDGNPLHNCILVADKRAKREAEQIQKAEALRNLWKRTNNLAVPSYMFPKILWLKKNKPDIFKRTYKFLSSSDYLIYKLCDKFYIDYLTAEKFYYDSEKEEYPPEILQYMDVRKSQLPEVVHPGTRVGNLDASLKEEFGFVGDAEIYITTYDALCAFYGTGAFLPGDACHVSGTCTSIRVCSDKKYNNIEGLFSQSFIKENIHIIGASNNLSGGLLEWIKAVFFRDERFHDNDEVFKLMEKEANSVAMGAGGLLFLPYLIGERAPFFDNDVRGLFLGVERFHTKAHFIKSIYEAIAFLSKDLLNYIEDQGVGVKRVILSGGLANNPGMNQILADVLGKDIFIVDELETTASGAFMIIANHQGKYESKLQLKNLVKIKNVIRSNKDNSLKYGYIFKLFKETYLNTIDLFQLRARICNKLSLMENNTIKNL